jgi:isopenicillin-N N-acyltransferase-like protein
MTVLELTGTAAQRGQAHGEALRQQIRQRVDATVGHAPGWAELIGPWWKSITGADVKLAAELSGIAAGSGCPVEQIVLLNAFEACEAAAQAELGGCTVLAIPHGGHGPLVAQNWDANDSLAATVQVHIHRGPDVLTTVVLASPGGVGWAGMNEAGVALANADLLTRGTAVTVPSQPMRRILLASASLRLAADKLRAHAVPGGRCYLLGGPDGIAMAEVAAEEAPSTAVADDQLELAAHTNHALSPRIAQWEDRALRRRIYPSTHLRYRRASALLAARQPTDASAVARILADHDHYPLSICRHESTREPTRTAASVIFDCGSRRASIALGNPCTAVYATYDL